MNLAVVNEAVTEMNLSLIHISFDIIKTNVIYGHSKKKLGMSNLIISYRFAK